jgi:hypothetical protein
MKIKLTGVKCHVFLKPNRYQTNNPNSATHHPLKEHAISNLVEQRKYELNSKNSRQWQHQDKNEVLHHTSLWG